MNEKLLKTSYQNFDKWWNAKNNVLYHFPTEDRYNEIMKNMARIVESSGILQQTDEELYEFCEKFVRYCSVKTGEHRGLLADFVEYLNA
jgi:hypothetical protein